MEVQAMSEPRAITREEAREKILTTIRGIVRYWAGLPNPDLSVWDRCDGVAFSILNIFDGSNVSLPAMNISLQPCEEDTAYNQEQGQNWYEPGMVINEDCQLHELYCHVAPHIQQEKL
jgi:hypothetical protein